MDQSKPLVIVNGEAVSDGTIICDGEPMTLNIYNPPPEGYVGTWPPTGPGATFRTVENDE